MRVYGPIALVFTLIFAGCAPPVEPMPPVAPTPPVKRDNFESSRVPSPPLPKPAPDANPAPGPNPGQANDHSNPGFKAGGVPEPKN
jgi:hypothetical protein